MSESNYKLKSLVSVAIILIVLTFSPVSGEIVSFNNNPITSDGNIDGLANKGNSAQDYTSTNNLLDGDQIISEQNVGNYSQNWRYYKNIYINSSNIDADLTNFPVYVELEDSDLKFRAQNDGDDIAFFDEGGNQLNHEFQTYNPDFNSSHAYLSAWVTMDLYSTRDTLLQMRYGNSTMTSQENKLAVWNQYNNVWHLEEDPGSAPQVTDSTYTNNGTFVGSMDSSDSVDAKLDQGLDFDGTDDLVDVGTLNSNLWTSVTVSAWFNKTANGDDRIFGFADKADDKTSIFLLSLDELGGGDQRDITVAVATDGTGGGDATYSHSSSGVFNLNEWNHVAFTWDAASELITVYLNGQFLTSFTKDGDTLKDFTGETAAIGNANSDPMDNRFFSGNIDEVRVSQVAKDQNWFKAEYLNQNNQSIFLSISDETKLNIEDPIDLQTDIDGKVNLGTQTNFNDFRLTDGIYNNLTERDGLVNTYSIGSGGSAAMQVGDGSPDWGSPTGTIGMWIRFNSLTPMTQRLWGMHGDMEMRMDSNGIIDLDWGGTGSLTSNYNLGINTWYFIAVTWDENQNDLTLYIATESTWPITAPQNEFWSSSLGSLTPQGNQFLDSRSSGAFVDGYGDELRYYDTELSASELSASYDKTLVGQEDGLISYFPFDDGTFTDYGPAASDGSQINLITFSSTEYPSINQGESTLELESKFTEIPYQQVGIDLSVRTGTFGTEALGIEYWNGGSWSSITSSLTANSWNNITITDLLTSSELIIRFIDQDRTDDTISDTWSIDAVLLTYQDYELDWEHEATGIDPNREYYNLTIFGQSSSVLESFNVQLWDGGAWSSVYDTITSTQGWYNTSITDPNVIGSTMNIRYTDTNRTMDDTQDSLNLDYVAIESFDISPVITSPASDTSYTEQTTGHSLEWTVTDDNPNQYIIYVDDVPQSPQSWISGSPISYNIDGLARGTHNITIELTDDYSGQTVHQVTVTVNDETNPVIEPTNDLTIVEQTTGISLNWSVSDLHPDSYEILQNGTEVDSGTWSNGNNITISLDGLSENVWNYTLVVRDDSNNEVTNTIMVIVNDETPPQVSAPDTVNYKEGSNALLNWTATDLHPDTYVLYRNGTQINASTWISGNAIRQNITGLAMGDYNFTIVLFDDSGYFAKHTTWVYSLDQTLPQITSPSDFSYGEGDTGNSITWTYSDVHPGQLTIYKNGSNILSYSWASGTLDFNIDGLGLGVYNYTIVLTDTSGNIQSDTVIVTVIDNDPPVLNSPADITLPEGSTGNEIVWVATDLHARNYTIFLDGSPIDSGYWFSGADISINIDGYVPDVYTYVIIVEDTSGQQVQDTVTVTVTAGSVFTDTPDDLDYAVGSTGNTISWTASDFDPANYTIYRNGTEVDSGMWADGVPIVYNVDGLGINVYEFIIIVNDTNSNEITDTVYVTVSDVPTWDKQQNDITYSEGSTGNTIQWNATDMFPESYVVYLEGAYYTSGTWSNALNITIDIDGLNVGIYNFTIFVNDTSNNVLSDWMEVTVIDTSPPTFTDSQTPYSTSEQSSGNIISWTGDDTYTTDANYTIYQWDGSTNSTIDTGLWTAGTPIQYNIDALGKGSYTFYIAIEDDSGNIATASVTIIVEDQTAPTFTDSQTPYTTNEQSSGNIISWTGDDTYTTDANYTIYQWDGLTNSTIDTGLWTTGTPIQYNIDALGKGTYTFYIAIEDDSGNIATASVTITVEDQTPPTFTDSQTPYTASEQSSGNIISWTGDDTYTTDANYTIYQWDGSTNSTIDTGLWTTGTPIQYNIDALGKGTYTFYIAIEDDSGNIATTSVTITVEDQTPPTFTDSQTPYTVSEESTGNVVSWTGDDAHPANYTIYMHDGTTNSTIDTGTWTSGTPIQYNIDALGKGTYTFYIAIQDENDVTVTASVIITIEDQTAPTFTDSQTPYTASEESTGNVVSWTGDDAHPDNYTIYQWDGSTNSTVDTGTWSSGTPIQYNIDGLGKGTYTFYIAIQDEDNNLSVNSVIITVEDITAPSVSDASSISYIEGTTGNTLSWTATDLYPDYYNITIDGVQIPYANYDETWQSGVEFSVNIDGYSIDQPHTIMITVVDQSGNPTTKSTTFYVYEVTPPQITSQTINNVTYSDGGTYYLNESVGIVQFNWTINDAHPGTYIYYINDVEQPGGTWLNESGFVLDFTGSYVEKGVYNYTFYFRDTSLNSIRTTVIVQIIDETAPQISGSTSYDYFRGTTGNQVSWTATDNYPYTYTVYRNNSIYKPYENQFWADGVAINIDVDDLDPGMHNFTIIVFDQSGNNSTMTAWVNMIDPTPPVPNTIPNNMTISEGDGDIILKWNYSDATPDIYSIYVNMSKDVDSLIWESNLNITYTFNGYQKGIYNITILIQDGAGYSYTNTTWITVLDTLDPEFQNTPDTTVVIVEGDSQADNLVWEMSDNHPANYTIYENGTRKDWGNWFSPVPLSYNLDYLTYGNYNITLIIQDESGNQVSYEVIVTVNDETSPVITQVPEPFTYIEGSTGYDVTWTGTDNHPDYYEFYINDQLIQTGGWTSGDAIPLISIDGLNYGDNNLTLVFYDEAGNQVTSTQIINVKDTLTPSINDSPGFTTIILDTTGNSISWTASDLHPGSYIIYKDGTVYQSGTWQSGTLIQLNVDGLDVGYYNFAIDVYDQSQNKVTDSMILRVKDPAVTDTIRPEFNLTNPVYEGDVEILNGTWLDINDEPVANGQITVTLTLQDEIFSYQTQTQDNGYYEIRLNYTGLAPGNYTWDFGFAKDGYQGWDNLSHDVQLKPHTYGIRLNAPPQLRQGEQYPITAQVYYANTNSSGPPGLSLSVYTEKTGAVEGVELRFTIIVEYADGEATYIKTGTSTDTGVVVVYLTPSDTEGAIRIQSITAELEGSSTFNAQNASFEASQLPQILPGTPDTLTQIQMFLEEYYIFIAIGAGILVLIGLLIVLLRRREKERIRELNNSIKVAFEEVKALEAMKAIIIQTKSKLTLYEELLNDDGMNTNLVGGMVSAFSSFLNEIGRNAGENMYGFETMERGDVSLTVHRGEHSNFIAISEIKLPFVLQGQIKGAQEEIENRFKSNLTNTSRGVKKLKKEQVYPALIDASLKIDLLAPLQLNKGNIRNLLRERSISRAIKQYIELIVELPESRYARNGIFRLTDIIDFYASKGVNKRMSSRIIVGAYQFDVITPVDTQELQELQQRQQQSQQQQEQGD